MVLTRTGASSRPGPATPQGLVFDLFGTLLDVAALQGAVARVTNRAAELVPLWRAKQLEYSWLRTVMGRHADFERVTRDALDYALARLGVALAAEEREQLMAGWRALPPYPDAISALPKLGRWRLAVLSNGTPRMLEEALVAAGLRRAFAHLISIEVVGVYKPKRRVYALAPAALGLPADSLLFVSANGWDVAGAAAAGLPTAWLNRAGAPLERLDAEPTLTVADLEELAAALDA